MWFFSFLKDLVSQGIKEGIPNTVICILGLNGADVAVACQFYQIFLLQNEQRGKIRIQT